MSEINCLWNTVGKPEQRSYLGTTIVLENQSVTPHRRTIPQKIITGTVHRALRHYDKMIRVHEKRED